MQRLTPWNGYTHFPSAQKMGRDGTLTPEAARRIYGDMARELAGAGINVNFGPVVDLSINPWNTVISRRKRSFGSDPNTVTSLARSFIVAHREANVAHRRQAFSRARLELGRQPQDASRYFVELAGKRA